VSKKMIALALFLLAFAVPALAFPPQCDCVFCTTHSGTTSCTLVPGNTVTTCGAYYPTHCEGPSGPTQAVPSREAFLASLAAPAR
jgi:hypothetical protein